MRVPRLHTDDLKNFPRDVAKYIEDMVESMKTSGYNAEEYGNYESLFGGDFILVEKEEDLKEILVITEDHRVTNILEDFGEVDYLKVLPGEVHVVILNCTNNSGGNTYFIPYPLILKRNVSKTIRKYQKEHQA